MVDLSNLSFGEYTAEIEDDLQDYFLESPEVIDKIEKGGKYLVLGRKGSGKTAIFKFLEKDFPKKWGRKVISLDLDGYPFEEHKKLGESGVIPALVFVKSWKLMICVSVLAEMYPELTKDQQKMFRNSITKLGSLGDAYLSKVGKWLKSLTMVELPSILDVGGGSVQWDSEDIDSYSIAASIAEMENLLADVYQHHPFTVLIDRIDDSWNADDYSKRFVYGAIRAARDINAKMNSVRSSSGEPSAIIVFLRTDIWDSIKFNDKNKLTSKRIELKWTDVQLRDVIQLRIRNSLGLSKGEVWPEAFEEGIVAQKRTSDSYIISRTMMKPRDAVAFCIYAAEARTDDAEKIKPEDVKRGEIEFSQHMLRELEDEMEPFVNTFVDSFDDVVRILRYIGVRSFSHDDWCDACTHFDVGVPDAESLLERLMESSAIGHLKQGGGEGGSRTEYTYSNRYLTPDPSRKFQFHHSLVDSLGLKQK